MFDLDDPNVRISLSLASYVSVRIGLGDRNRTSCPHPQQLAILSTRLRQHRTALGGGAAEFEQYSAGIAIARISALIHIPLFNLASNALDPLQPRSGARGRRTWIANPCGSRFSASIVPPIASTLRRAIHNPIPK